MYNRLAIILACSISFASSNHIWAAGKKVALPQVFEESELPALIPLLRLGEVSLVQSHRNGRLKQVIVISLIESSPKKVWETLTDYRNYVKFMPSLVEIEIKKIQGNDVVIAYELEVPGSNMDYTLRHRHTHGSQIDISLEDDEGDIQTGAWRWRLIPWAKGSKTILIYQIYTDVAESSWLVRQAIKSQPTMEHGLNVATGLVTIQAIKKRAEK